MPREIAKPRLGVRRRLRRLQHREHGALRVTERTTQVPTAGTPSAGFRISRRAPAPLHRRQLQIGRPDVCEPVRPPARIGAEREKSGHRTPTGGEHHVRRVLIPRLRRPADRLEIKGRRGFLIRGVQLVPDRIRPRTFDRSWTSSPHAGSLAWFTRPVRLPRAEPALYHQFVSSRRCSRRASRCDRIKNETADYADYADEIGNATVRAARPGAKRPALRHGTGPGVRAFIGVHSSHPRVRSSSVHGDAVARGVAIALAR